MNTEVESRPEKIEEDQNQHLGESRVEGVAPDPTQPVPTVELRHETWPHEDVRRVIKGLEYLHSRNVAVSLACVGCKKTLQLRGRDNGGASLMACGCVVRRWL